jgi:hypothetical protein
MEVTRFLEMLVTTHNGTECGTAGDKALHYHLHYTFNKPTKEIGNVKITNKEKGRMKGKRNEKKGNEKQRKKGREARSKR